LVKVVLIGVAMPGSAVTIAMAITRAIRAYSIAVAPRLS
jgi:hypothetical protein